MECSRYNLILLLFRQLIEVDRVTGNPDCKLRIFLRMCLRIQKRILRENIHIEMVSTLFCVSIKQGYKIIYL